MSNLATVTQIRPIQRPVERRVAEIEDGYTRLANALYDELIGADLTKNQSKVAHAICRKTYGFGKKLDRISDSQLAQLTRLPRQKVNKAKNELIEMKVILREGSQIGPNKNISEWEIEGCHYSGDNVTKLVTKSVTKTVTAMSPKQSHTKETIQKKEINNTPLPPNGGGDGQENLERRKPERIDYESFLEAYNAEVGDKLPHAVAVNEKRKRRLKKIIPQLKTPNVDGFRAYVRAFVHQAKPFYFGDNNTGWTADLDYLLRDDTLTGVREAKFAGRGMA
ncbi:DNA replication protein [Klebsiella aerogenes]|uniref:replication protein n=1 Tax=Klebsiella aerogenes TaxID=548 RepID=UPI00075BB33E|nr:replication protein [Klebsiella aerogenes]KVI72206.1 DNA replication protein [Klebsiella aerogenes]KVI72545.1 DNA replication protein [Klebsiella aerogenes]